MSGLPRLWYCDHYEFPLPPGHRFPTAKYGLLREALADEPGWTFHPAPLAEVSTVSAVHDPEYVAAFVEGTLDPKVLRRIGFPWSRQLVCRTLASVGGTIEATKDAVARGWGGNLAGGTHHAFRNEGAGFCVFNDIAVAIRALGIRRPAIVDLDVHQGDGTASIFSEDADVLTLSLHGSNNFPFRKQISRIDIAFADATTDEEYLRALPHALQQVRDFGPDVIFYQSGVDGLACDKLGRLALTHAGLEERDRMVFEMCTGLRTPCVVTLGGGYAEPVSETVAAHANTFRIAARIFR